MGESTEQSLKRIALLSSLRQPELLRVETACSWKWYGPEEQIIDRRSETQDVFFMAQGTVRVVNYSLSGREITFDDVGEGRYFGEMSAIDGEPESVRYLV